MQIHCPGFANGNPTDLKRGTSCAKRYFPASYIRCLDARSDRPPVDRICSRETTDLRDLYHKPERLTDGKIMHWPEREMRGDNTKHIYDELTPQPKPQNLTLKNAVPTEPDSDRWYQKIRYLVRLSPRVHPLPQCSAPFTSIIANGVDVLPSISRPWSMAACIRQLVTKRP